LVLCEAKTECNEFGAARAEGIVQIIFFMIFFIWPSRYAVAVLRASQVRFFNLRLKERCAPKTG
jgi:hypothetical protein